MNQGFIGIQVLNHEKSTLEAREVTKLHYHDSTSSNDEFSSYAQSIKLISTRSTTYPVNHKTLDLCPDDRRCLNLFTKEDRQPRNRLSLLFKPSDKTIWRLYGIPSKELHQREIFSPYVNSEPSDETIRRLYGIPSKENYGSDH